MAKKKRYPRWMMAALMVMVMAALAGCSAKEDPEVPVETPPETQSEPEENSPEEEEPEEDTLTKEELKDLFGKGKGLTELYYEMKVSGMGQENNLSRMYLKGGKMRAESEVMGQTFVMIHGEDALYILDASSKTAMKMPLGEDVEGDQDVFSMEDFTGDVDDTSMTYVGKETLNGVPCRVVESKNLQEGYEVKMWLHEEYGFPMKMESKKQDGTEAFRMEVTEFQIGDVSDDLFEVPEDYEIVDMGSLIPGTP